MSALAPRRRVCPFDGISKVLFVALSNTKGSRLSKDAQSCNLPVTSC